MENYYLIENNRKINILDKVTGEIIWECISFVDDDNDDDFHFSNENSYKKITFYKHNDQQWILYHDYSNGDLIFPKILLVNLETKESISLEPQFKMGYDEVIIDEHRQLIILFGYVMGMCMGYLIYDFDGNFLASDDVFGEELLSTKIFGYKRHKFTIENSNVYLNLLIPKKYFNKNDFPYSEIKFDVKKIGFDELSNVGNETIILKCFDVTNNKEIISYEEIKNIVDFLESCEKYTGMKDIIHLLKTNDKNIFKYCLENDISNKNMKITKSDECKKFLDLNISDITKIECNGLYTGNKYCSKWSTFLRYKFTDSLNFGKWLAENTLGYQYVTQKFIDKTLLPNGIGLVFKLFTVDKTIYKFTIKMKLVDVVDDETKLTYDEDKCIVDIDVKIEY